MTCIMGIMPYESIQISTFHLFQAWMVPNRRIQLTSRDTLVHYLLSDTETDENIRIWVK
jgi:hypothetical protein